MSELIAKSKMHKIERQKQRDEDEEMRAELDEGLDELRGLLAESVPVKPAVQLPGPERAAGIAGQTNDKDYDQDVRALAFDARSKPKDRTKTEEEEAADEVARLQEAEAKRLRRMRGEESDDEDGAPSKRRKTDRAPDADDLGDDFMGEVDEEGNVLLGEGLTRKAIEEMAPESDEGSDEEGSDEESGEVGEEGEEGEEGSDEDDDDDDDDDESVSDLEDLDSDDAESDDEAPQLVPVKKKRKAPVAEIPFIFPCPSTLQEFEEIVDPLPDSALPTVVQRIRALHHPSLAQGNKEKLQDFLGVLLDYMLVLASEDKFDSITALGPHLAALVKLNPLTASSHFIAKLSLMQKNLAKGLARGASNPSSKTLPGAPELTLLRLVGTTWSTSDFSHPVAQPAMLLMGQYLSQSRIRSTSDLASGLFLVSLIAQYEGASKRLVPEAVNFLASAILALLKRKKDAPSVRAFPNLVAVELHLATGVAPHHPINLLSARTDSEQTRSNLLAAALRLIQSYASLYAPLEAFAELFAPLHSILSSSRAKLAADLKALFTQTTSQLENQLRLAATSRAPLALQDHKPIPIASYAPKFESDFAPGRHYDPDVERNAAAKLRAEYKKERKGAIRELRKDNRFLASERAREQAAKDDEYNAKMRKVHGSLNAERAEEKEMEREKKREKRRRGN
jgi:nucleolar protein 14